MKFPIVLQVFLTAGLSLLAPAYAHFPFIAPDEDRGVVLFFGENLGDRTYHLPPAIEKAVLWRVGQDGDSTKLDTKSVDSDDFVGLSSDSTLKPGDSVVAQIRYGIYHGSRLDYYCAYCQSIEAASSPVTTPLTPGGSHLDLNASLESNEKEVRILVTWKGQPLPSAKITLSCQKGQVIVGDKTDSEGAVVIPLEQVEEGLNALLVGHKVNESGELNGQSYQSSSHYLTVTFRKPAK